MKKKLESTGDGIGVNEPINKVILGENYRLAR